MVKKEKEVDKGPVVSIDGVEYPVKDLNEQQRYYYYQMHDLTNKQARAQNELDQIKAALGVFRDGFMQSTKEQAEEILEETHDEVDEKVS
tara:strand:+ start:205 stop:474 length:270 start_codon:yes stop_codon:yes gene_type:complete